MTSVDRIEVASKFLLQSPPGEINDVLNGTWVLSILRTNEFLTCQVWCTDVREIVADDGALQEGIQPVLQQYNMEQFVTATVPEHEHQVRLSFL